jgi:isopenicillin N synthase-like dioxygenase
MTRDAAKTSLPVLDLRRLGAQGDERTRFLKELRDAARTYGFFYLTGHGVEDRLIQRVLALSRRFFSLSESEKLEIEMVNSPHFRGYTRPGYEYTRGKQDWREQVDIGAESAALALTSNDPAWKRLQGPNQWPAALPELKPVLLEYQANVTALAIRIIRAFSAALDQPENVFEPIYSPAPTQLIKIIRYPGRAAGESDQGVGPHKDSGFLAVLLQDQVAGLQVQGEDGWIDAPPVASSFIVNVGEIFELASNGYLRANVHRVVSPPIGEDRLSVAFFLGARLDSQAPLLALPAHLAAESQGVTQDPLNPLFRDAGRNYLKGRLRSHPDVARRHHADLLGPSDGKPELASAY